MSVIIAWAIIVLLVAAPVIGTALLIWAVRRGAGPEIRDRLSRLFERKVDGRGEAPGVIIAGVVVMVYTALLPIAIMILHVEHLRAEHLRVLMSTGG